MKTLIIALNLIKISKKSPNGEVELENNWYEIGDGRFFLGDYDEEFPDDINLIPNAIAFDRFEEDTQNGRYVFRKGLNVRYFPMSQYGANIKYIQPKNKK